MNVIRFQSLHQRGARSYKQSELGVRLKWYFSPPVGISKLIVKERFHFSLFDPGFSGMFPESIRNWRLRRFQVGSFLDYIKTGKESYDVVAAFNQFEYKPVTSLFSKLRDNFEECVYGLHLVKQQIEAKRIEKLIH